MSEINGTLTAEIEKNKTRDGSIPAEIERLLTDVYKKLSTEVNTKIANELSARLSEINSTFTAELDRINNDLNNKLNEEVNAGFGKINTELNGKLTAEAEKNKARDDDFTREAQEILNDITTKVNNIEEACRNEFRRINVVIENLQNETNQHYA